MSDDAALERHKRHEDCMRRIEERVETLEAIGIRTDLWITGDGNPHRGAEHRLSTLEEGVCMKKDMEEMIDRVVAAKARSFATVMQALAPYAVLAIAVIVWIVTGQPPKVSP